jgi:hypothetical protein
MYIQQICTVQYRVQIECVPDVCAAQHVVSSISGLYEATPKYAVMFDHHGI